MPASINDKLKKYKSLFSTTLSTGIGTGTSDTITPATVTGLPTDTAITLTIDRVDASGTATPSKMERIKGVVSSGNIINYVRAVDGTTEQAHTAGAVVEMVWNADDWNDLVDWGLVAHNQDGTHKSGSVLTLPQINDTTADHQYVMSVCELTADRTVALPLLTGNDEFVFKDHAQTLTNKRITPRVLLTASTATLTVDCNSYDMANITAQAEALTVNAPSGTPTNGQQLIIKIADNGTTRAITWNAIFRPIGVTMTTNTVAWKTYYLTFIFDTYYTKWDCIQVNSEA